MARDLLFSAHPLRRDLTQSPIREETKMKMLVIALLSSPVLLAYELKPDAMQQAVVQVLHYLLSCVTS